MIMYKSQFVYYDILTNAVLFSTEDLRSTSMVRRYLRHHDVEKQKSAKFGEFFALLLTVILIRSRRQTVDLDQS